MDLEKPTYLFTTSMFFENDRKHDNPPMFKTFGNHDFILFTNKKININEGWKQVIINEEEISKIIPNYEEIKSRRKNITIQRYFKFMLWKYVEDYVVKKYSMIVYCDGFMSPKREYNWDNLNLILKTNESGIIQKQHRNNVYKECSSIITHRKDTKENMLKMHKYLEENKCPKKAIMCENTAFIYDPKNKKLQEGLNEFWKEYSTYDITYRDQPLWGYIQYKHNIKPIYKNDLFESCFNKGRMGNHIYR